VAHVARKPRLTKQRLADVVGMLQELERRGTAAVPVIGDLLRSGIDLDFGTLGATGPRGERTLREALIDTLLQIGGGPATAVALEQLRATRNPLETALLARGLEAEEPGTHTEAVLDAIDDGLQWAGEAQESVDLGPLFDLLRGYGGERALALLQRSVPQWGEYALIALAGLPDGEGIPTLTSLAATRDAPIENPVLPFQALAQATTASPEAAEALLDLARSDRIPDQAWSALGDVLAGKHLRFARSMLDGTPLADGSPNAAAGRPSAWKSYYIEWMNVRYEQDVVTAEWSPDQVQQQVALIDALLAATSSPLAAQALQQARASLQF
jgi:hypothetical protein